MSPRLLPLADIALPQVVGNPLAPRLDNPVAALLTFVAIVVIEAGLLRWLRWGGWGRVLLVSFVINLVTTLLGFLLGWFALASLGLAWVPLAFALTVLIEGALLKVLQPSATLARAFLASLIINAASYALLAVLAPLFAAASPRPLPPPYRGLPRPQPIPLPDRTPPPPP